MTEVKLIFDTKIFNPEKIKLILRELEAVAIVKENRIIFNEDNQEQKRKVIEIFDKYLPDYEEK